MEPVPFSTSIARGVLAAALLGSAAAAQCNQAGVDLIVLDVTSATNHAASATHDAATFALTFCNIGVLDAAWSGSSREHPVAVEALYRLQDFGAYTRFEQIGMSWAFHQSDAMGQPTACGCNPTTNTHLGAGCSCPSSGSQFGSPTTIGPRIDIDPGASELSYPPSAAPAPPGPSAGRVRFALADVDPNATYVAEAQVVAFGEEPFGRADDASWRRAQIALAGGNATVTLQGATTPRQSALAAWAQLAPSVSFASHLLPTKETIEFAWQVVDLGGGWWRYEYAVHNLDLTEGLATFRVPIAAGVAVREIGFHDVDYHGGDGIDGTDWSSALAAGELAWSTTPFATDPDANALRWGTTYNFRFDASAPPAPGIAKLDVFAGPGAITHTLSVPSSPPFAAFCAGDGGGAACPCGNESLLGAGEGCENSLGRGGRLAAGGLAHLANDRLVLFGTGMTNSTALYFQGATQVGGGLGAVFGDGLRCAGGATVRLSIETNAGGASQYPSGFQPPISVRGQVTAPGTRTYQAWYRNPASFCTPSTFNLTNGVVVSWS